VNVAPSRIARLRAVEVAPETFRTASLAALASLYLVITTGAVVRLTASGLGCDNWPRCGNAPFPEKGGHAFIEFGNRVVALFAIGFTLISWLAARRVHGLPRRLVVLALAVFLGTVAQIPLGGLTVIFNLNPLLVMAHFLLAMLVLACAVLVVVGAHANVVGEGEAIGPRWLRRAGLVLVISCFVLVTAGAFATAAGPHPGGSDISRIGEPLRSVRVHGVFTILFAVSFLAVLVFLERGRPRLARIADAGLGLLALLIVQIAVGEIQYRTDLPWWLVLVHVSLAAAVWAGTVALVAVLWRPPVSLVRPAT
jgi:cytochrome c oxidase assembly protein subunit 15